MSRQPPDPSRALKAPPRDGGYDVGYAKPPSTTRFKPGQSGNPKGRPRGSKNRQGPPALNEERLKAIIMQEAYRGVTVNDASGPRAIPMAQAVVRAIAVNAAKGHQRAQRLFTDLVAATERENNRLNDAWLDAALTYKIAWERELARRKALGVAGPEPLPHPDHVVIDIRSGSARITGPATKEEKAQWDTWIAHIPEFEKELRELEAKLKKAEGPDRRELGLEADKTKKVLEYLKLMNVQGKALR